MTAIAKSIVVQLERTGAYFFKDEPKQLFVAAELGARWFVIFSRQPQSATVEKVIAYSLQAQEVFNFPLALRSCAALVGRLAYLKGEHKTTFISDLSATAVAVAGCVEVVVDKILGIKLPHASNAKLVEVGAGLFSDVLDVASLPREMKESSSWAIGVLKAIKVFASFLISATGVAIAFASQNYILPFVQLMIETSLFFTKLVNYLIELNEADKKVSNNIVKN